MKKLISLLMSLLILITPAMSEAPAASCGVYVSITDDTGALVMAYAPVTVTDTDADGMLTIHDALYAAHAAAFPAGTQGYCAEATEFGLSMTRLWGVENGGSYGYYLNDASAWSLLDAIKDGDHIKAYAFTDMIAWSDTYCWFQSPAADAATGETFPLTLLAAGYDEMWNPMTLPVEGAMLTIDGSTTEIMTDAQGQACLSFSDAGAYVVSAVSDSRTLVSPVCIVTVTAAE